MNLLYRGYRIVLTVNLKNGVWAVEIKISPKLKTRIALNHMTELDGFNSAAKARSSGLKWAKDCIDLHATTTTSAKWKGALGQSAFCGASADEKEEKNMPIGF
jgi:hypothetical protein